LEVDKEERSRKKLSDKFILLFGLIFATKEFGEFYLPRDCRPWRSPDSIGCRNNVSHKVNSFERDETVYKFLLRSWRKAALFSRKLDIFNSIR